MERTRVTLLGSIIDVAKSIASESSVNQIKTIIANRDSILKKCGIKELLKEPVAAIAYEKAAKSGNKLSKEFVTKVKTSSSANGGNGKGIPTVEKEQPTIEGNEIGY